MNHKSLLFLIYLFFSSTLFGEEVIKSQEMKGYKYNIRVGLEVTPGLLQEDEKGAMDLALKELTQKSKQFKFNIQYLSYQRAKVELEKGNLDFIGLTPHGHEQKSFYKYAQELNWKFDTNLVLFCSSKKALDLKNGEEVGTPPGNEAFAAKALGIKQSRFEMGNLKSLLMRVDKGRLPCLVYEEISTLHTAKEMGIKSLYFRKIDHVSASFAFRKGPRVAELIHEMDNALKEINWQKYLINLIRIPLSERSGRIKP